jgi:ADP-ribose pyrophosphatase YjhB (NUDIX family)
MKKFVVRVYGIGILNNAVLLSEEVGQGKYFTKFPGGGLEWGEGTIRCLEREFKEELDVEICVKSHLYTTDFFLQSAFNPDDQIISIYYLVAFKNPSDVLEKVKWQNGKKLVPPVDEHFIWKPLAELSENDVTFPADKKVVSLLKDKYGFSAKV